MSRIREAIGNHPIIATGVAAGAVVIGSGALAVTQLNEGNHPSVDVAAAAGVDIHNGDSVEKQKAALRQFFDVDNRVSCLDPSLSPYLDTVKIGDSEIVKIKIGALQDGRVSTDALSTPLNRNNPESTQTELFARLCEDDLLTETWATAIANQVVGGVRLGDAIPELEYAKGPLDKINDRALANIPTLDKNKDGNYTDAELAKIVEMRERHMRRAEVVATILSRLKDDGYVEDITPESSYALNLAGISAGKLPEIGEGKKYPGDFLQMSATYKGLAQCALRVEVNLDDGRPAFIGCEVPQPGKPSTKVRITTPPSRNNPPTPPRRTPIKHDGDTTPGGVPGRNGGSGTAQSGPTGPGEGKSGQPVRGDGTVGGEKLPVAPAPDKIVKPAPVVESGEVTGQTTTAPTEQAKGEAGTGDASTVTPKP